MARPRYVGTVLALGASSCRLLEALGYPSGSLRTLPSYCEGSPRYIRRFSEGLCLLPRRFRAIEDRSELGEDLHLDGCSCPFISHHPSLPPSAIASPAIIPVVHADWKLKPPVTPSMSSTSPAK